MNITHYHLNSSKHEFSPCEAPSKIYVPSIPTVYLFKQVLFHQDFAKQHTCLVAIAKFNGLGYELLYHLPYYADLFHSDENLKKRLCRKRFGPKDEIITKQNNYFDDVNNSFYLEESQYWRNVGPSIWSLRRIPLLLKRFLCRKTFVPFRYGHC